MYQDDLKLCVPCAETMKEAMDVQLLRSVREKFTCANYRKRRYGNLYHVGTKKREEP